MSTLKTNDNKVNTYTDLRGHGLNGTDYKWVFKITPTYNNHFQIKVLLKPMGMFSMFARSRYSTELTMDISDNAVFVDHMKQALDRVLTVEHVKRVVGDKEL